MASFSIGPPQGGAGVGVSVKDASVGVSPGAFGSTQFTGVTRKGPINTPIVCFSKDEAERRLKFSDLIREDETPLAIKHFYDLSGGSSPLVMYRVDDGNSVAAKLDLYDRDVYESVLGQAPDSKVNTLVSTFDAASPGIWGGNEYYYGGALATDAGLSALSTLTTGLAIWNTNELAGTW